LEAVGARNPVDNHRVRRGADRPREAAVALEDGPGVLRADEPLGGLIELGGRDPRARLALQQLMAAGEDPPRRGDLLYLPGGLLDDQSSASSLRVARVARI